MQEVIKVQQLTKTYGRLLAADNISLSVTKGMVFGLLGANGAGKSTTIECILGTKKADHGQISVLGMDPMTDRKNLFEKVGVQFQETNYQDQITVWELCEATASLYHNAADPVDLLKRFGIAPNTKIAGVATSILYFPMLIFSGATLPYEIMPDTLKKAADILPLTQGIKLLKAASLGLPTDNMFVPVIVMCVIGLICIFVSLKCFQWE